MKQNNFFNKINLFNEDLITEVYGPAPVKNNNSSKKDSIPCVYGVNPNYKENKSSNIKEDEIIASIDNRINNKNKLNDQVFDPIELSKQHNDILDRKEYIQEQSKEVFEDLIEQGLLSK